MSMAAHYNSDAAAGSDEGTPIARGVGDRRHDAGAPECSAMPRNQLKSLPCAWIRRGLAHVHPAGGSAGRSFATAPDVDDTAPHAPSDTPEAESPRA